MGKLPKEPQSRGSVYQRGAQMDEAFGYQAVAFAQSCILPELYGPSLFTRKMCRREDAISRDKSGGCDKGRLVPSVGDGQLFWTPLDSRT